MKIWFLLLGLQSWCAFSQPQEISRDLQKIVHSQGAIETPDSFKKEFAESHPRWQSWNDHSVAEPSLSEELDAVEVVLDKVINLGKKMWGVIEAGRPVVNVQSQFANALPVGVRASDLENFSDLQFQSFRLQGVNYFGATVYDVVYTLVHRYGGSYQGRGAYLESVTVLPQRVEVLWGYNVDFKVERVSTVNTGSAENPIASLALETAFRVSTPLQELRTKNIYEFKGNSPTVNSSEVP